MGDIEPHNEGRVLDHEDVVRFGWHKNQFYKNGSPHHKLFKPPKRNSSQESYCLSMFRNYQLDNEEIKEVGRRRILQEGGHDKIVGWATIHVGYVRNCPKFSADFFPEGPPRHVNLTMMNSFESWQNFAQALAHYFTVDHQYLESPLSL